mgnify:CR=1 FL=1
MQNLRDPEFIEDLRPGDHLCCLYSSEEEHRAVLAPYLLEGLKRGEKVLYIVDAHTAETILGYLRNNGLDLGHYLQQGQLTILTQDESYVRDGVFDPDAMLALVEKETEQAAEEGYTALRVTGEMSWALRGLPGSDRLIEYEAKLNRFFPHHRALAICQYDRRRFDADVLMGILRTHPLAVIGAEIFDNFYYIPPDDLLGENPQAAELQRWIENLAQRKRMERELRANREQLQQLVQERTARLQTVMGATTGRELRMAELKDVIRQLRKQLEDAGITPEADDPLSN